MALFHAEQAAAAARERCYSQNVNLLSVEGAWAEKEMLWTAASPLWLLRSPGILLLAWCVGITALPLPLLPP